MMSISEFFLLGLSLGTLNNWSKNINQDPVHPLSQDERSSVFQPETESKSLYDLMAHFPQDKGIICPESDSRFRYPGECSRYITCRDYNAHIRLCPPGMYFDDNYGHCRPAFEVDCEPMKFQFSCGVDEEYSDCGCERTCRDVDDDDMCVNHCDRGCFCRSGFVRDDAGNCVEAEACENSLHSLFNSNYENYY